MYQLRNINKIYSNTNSIQQCISYRLQKGITNNNNNTQYTFNSQSNNVNSFNHHTYLSFNIYRPFSTTTTTTSIPNTTTITTTTPPTIPTDSSPTEQNNEELQQSINNMSNAELRKYYINDANPVGGDRDVDDNDHYNINTYRLKNILKNVYGGSIYKIVEQFPQLKLRINNQLVNTQSIYKHWGPTHYDLAKRIFPHHQWDIKDFYHNANRGIFAVAPLFDVSKITTTTTTTSLSSSSNEVNNDNDNDVDEVDVDDVDDVDEINKVKEG
ncbi:hypothetical protein PPL_07258 [Heterostelium album PN500]|uniref:Uncharacterized protein n=1 Tax=Heterostelium pallidum (strain ATCC 26659 / Pp 5 / PN500) TaxID=670386 RepID=D3BEU3_HETP5|nr:hypothetical protein PPL_07258 [Heterostelium album PN500]EFA80424.1 hypothetical protein PPL_07258 [Heterostelium album PN500]|eukprot:XP_020432544.1 hypothetical protein PPL_07258 [Heterostelium album PN500]